MNNNVISSSYAEEYVVTLAIYSGLPDPVWTINSSHKSFKAVKEHLNDAKSRRTTHRQGRMSSVLGYKGFLVHSPAAEQNELVVGQETAVQQKLLLETMPEGLISDALHNERFCRRSIQELFQQVFLVDPPGVT